MKTINSFLIIILFIFCHSLNAQTPSYQTKKIEGKEYILYPVEAGEGLYGIGRKFNVSVEKLNELNPEASIGLKTGQIILIPQSKTISKETISSKKNDENITSKNTTGSLKNNYTEYLVDKKQTLFAICRKFDIEIEELKKMNPELENGLRVGMTLKIPNSKANEDKKEKSKCSDKNESKVITKESKHKNDKKTVVIKHIVKAKETLYAISRLYNVEVKDIIKLNPESASSLIIGSELNIEVKKEIAATIQPEETSKVIEPEVIKPKYSVDDLQYLTCITQNVKPNTTPLKIAILLPLVIENAKTDAVNERFQEFYAGILLAAKEAKNKGVSIEIYAFDTEKTEEKITEVLQNSTLKTVDLIIGPAYTNQIPLVSDFAKENKINAVIPFSSKVTDLANNPYLYQFNATNRVEIEYLSNLLSQSTKPQNIIFVDLASITNNENGFEFSQNLKNALTAKNCVYNVLEMATEQSVQTTTLLDKEKTNIVIFNSDKFSNIFPYLSFLNTKAQEYDIQLYEQYSWKNQNAQVKFKTFSIAPFKPLINDDDFKNYDAQFMSNFGWKKSSNNPQYDVLGYDLGNYFIALLYEFGPQFSWDKKKLPLASGIQSFLKFERSNVNSGFVNKQLYLHEK